MNNAPVVSKTKTRTSAKTIQSTLPFKPVVSSEKRNYGEEIRSIMEFHQQSFELIMSSLRKSFQKQTN